MEDPQWFESFVSWFGVNDARLCHNGESNLEQHGIIIGLEQTCQDFREQQLVAHIEFDKEKQSLTTQI